jgi:hypothetical protein
MARWLALPLLLAPAIAFAAPLPPEDVAPEAVPQAPPPPQYANPYAPPQYANPYAAPQYEYPPGYGYGQTYPAQPQYGYGCAQPCCPPQPTCCSGCAAGHARTDGWRTVIGDDGAWYREREVKKGNAGLIATGLVLWLGAWMGTGWGGTMHDGAVGAISFFPFAGPFVSASLVGNGGAATGYVIGGLTQVTGFILLIAGASSKHVVRERERISWGAAPTQNGFAANLSVRF